MTSPNDDQYSVFDQQPGHRPIPQEEPVEPNASAAEAEATGQPIKGTLNGREILIPPVKKWKASALSWLRDGDFDRWAEIVLDDEAWKVWEEVDPDMEQIDEFFKVINSQLGTDPGNSRASRRSSTRRLRR